MKYNIFSISNPFIINDYIWYSICSITEKLKEYEDAYNNYLDDIEAPYEYVFEWLRHGNHDIKLITTFECNDESEAINFIKHLKNKPTMTEKYKNNFSKDYRKNWFKAL